MVYSIIDVGGGMRDAFGAGVVDRLLDDSVDIGICVGVSAGASNLANYISGQRERTLRFFGLYPERKEYMSLRNLIFHGSYLNMRYIYEELSFPDGEDPWDVDAYTASGKDFTIVATDARTGEPVYFPKESIKPFEMRPIEASGTIPVLCRPTVIDGIPYFDGGLSDPIPFRKAFEKGADRVIIVITKRKDDFRSPGKDRLPARILERSYPAAGRALRTRAERYNAALREALQLEKEGRALILAPDDTCGVTTTKHRSDDVRRLYGKGYEAAGAVKLFMNP